MSDITEAVSDKQRLTRAIEQVGELRFGLSVASNIPPDGLWDGHIEEALVALQRALTSMRAYRASCSARIKAAGPDAR